MSRSKGPGAIKFIDATKQDDVAMRRILWRGNNERTADAAKLKSLRAERARLAVQQVNLRGDKLRLCAWIDANRAKAMARADAEQLLRNVEFEERCLEPRVRDVDKQIEETQKQIAKLPRQRNPVFAWQEEVIACVSLAYLADDTPKTLTEHAREAAQANRNLKLVEQRKREQAAMTPAQFEERIRKPLHPAVVAVPIACSRRHAAQSDKVLAFAGKKVDITLEELRDHLRAHGHTPPPDSVRRFLRKTLHVTLRSEQGKRTDLKSKAGR